MEQKHKLVTQVEPRPRSRKRGQDLGWKGGKVPRGG